MFVATNTISISNVMKAQLLFVTFISYVTAADSNTDAIGNLFTKGVAL